MDVTLNEGGRRPYRQRLRAASSAATRQRIVDATLALHQELGPAMTTVAAIARRAGVPRMTIYRHFPDEESLFDACSGAYAVEHPPPDIGTALAEREPIDRLLAVMASLFAYYRATEPMTAQLLRSAETHAPTRERLRPYRDLIEMTAQVLTPGLVADPARRHVVSATVRHALTFATWQSLARDGGLTDEEVSDALVGLIFAAGRSSPWNAAPEPVSNRLDGTGRSGPDAMRYRARMDEPIQSSMRDGTDFLARLDAIEARLAEHDRRAPPPGLTEPDPGAEERWEAAQVWAHMAEFVAYWREQVESIVGEYAGEPVPFGRVKTDAGRIAAIEMGRHEPIARLAERVDDAVAGLRRYLAGLTVAEWAAVGWHQTRGEMDVEQILEEFILRHLDEHLTQLEGLADAARA